ncbi:hypothetical protein ACFQGT_16305 [Natrialbaceae archaeon GCM10025810]|uniref:hypothetical protein n=1 Tax=Halovalidus salilacus TaxID=3075124 RepID=UPI0036196FAB
MSRNTIMIAIGALCLAALITAALGLYRPFSYLAAGVILAVVASAATEQNDSELSLEPYTGIVAGLGVLFLIGLTGIWLTWDPTVTEYEYVLGLPIPTLIYFAFIWFLPLGVAIYYSLIFDRIGSEEIVEEIVRDARRKQEERTYPLAPDRADRETGGPDLVEVSDE